MGPEDNPKDDMPIDREEYEAIMGEGESAATPSPESVRTALEGALDGHWPTFKHTLNHEAYLVCTCGEALADIVNWKKTYKEIWTEHMQSLLAGRVATLLADERVRALREAANEFLEFWEALCGIEPHLGLFHKGLDKKFAEDILALADSPAPPQMGRPLDFHAATYAATPPQNQVERAAPVGQSKREMRFHDALMYPRYGTVADLLDRAAEIIDGMKKKITVDPSVTYVQPVNYFTSHLRQAAQGIREALLIPAAEPSAPPSQEGREK